jgi:hypothetical protein
MNNCNLNTQLCSGDFLLIHTSSAFKTVLLHKRNDFPSIPLAHAVHMKETYDREAPCFAAKWIMMNTVEYMS